MWELRVKLNQHDAFYYSKSIAHLMAQLKIFKTNGTSSSFGVKRI